MVAMLEEQKVEELAVWMESKSVELKVFSLVEMSVESMEIVLAA
jgi:hypothetical protein